MQRTFDIVVAADLKGGIGKNGTLPWKLPGDMAYFKHVTSEVRQPGKRNAVIMGRKTWDSIPAKFRPLKDRLNIVLTRSDITELPGGTLVAASLDEALKQCDKPEIENVFVIGGGSIYAEALAHQLCFQIYLTKLAATFDCDICLPELPAHFRQLPQESDQKEESGIKYWFRKYENSKMASREHA